MNHPLYHLLAIFAGIVGLIVTGAAVFTIWAVLEQRKKWRAENPETRISPAELAGRYLMKWTVMDYAVLMMAAFGILFLFADVVAVIRDRQNFPYYHYGYLVLGFILTLLGMLFTFVRLAIVLRVSHHPGLPAEDHHHKPNEADEPEQRI